MKTPSVDPPPRPWRRWHRSIAEAPLEGVPPERAWAFVRDPASARILLPDVVEAAVVSGSGVGEHQRYVSRSGRRDTVSLVEVTALVPGRLIELVVLNRPFPTGRSFTFAPAGGSTLLTLRSWAYAGWHWIGLDGLLQDDDDEYAARISHVLPVLGRQAVVQPPA